MTEKPKSFLSPILEMIKRLEQRITQLEQEVAQLKQDLRMLEAGIN